MLTFHLPETPPRLPPSAQGAERTKLLPSWDDIRPLLVLTGVYLALALIGLRWTLAYGLGAVLWPAAGLALAVLLLRGVRLWPAVVVGRLLASFLSDAPQPWWADVLVAGGAAAGAAIPAAIILRRGAFDPMLSRLTDLFRLMVWGALVGSLISAATGLPALMASGAPPGALPAAALNWVMGFAAGVVVVAPLILAWSPRAAWQETPLSWMHLAFVTAGAAALTSVVFLQPPGFFRTWHVYPVLIWAAVGFNARGSSVVLLVLSLGAVTGARLGLGPNAAESFDIRMLLTQHMILVTAATTLVLASLADERRSARKLQAARDSAEGELAARRRMQGQQQLLINELNHRVKNTLATVQSMVAQTLRHASGLEAADQALTARILALSNAHDVLTREKWTGADVREVVRVACAPFAAPGAHIQWQGPSLTLPPAMALGLGMALHELGTNAVKHGALRHTDGRVDIRWTAERQVGGITLNMVWRERGGEPVTPPARKGFGSRLLERGLPAQLGGPVELRFEPEGLVCVISARLPREDSASDGSLASA